MRLSHRDFDALQRASLELHAYRDVEEFWRAAANVYLKIFSVDYFVMTGYEIDPLARSAAIVEYRESDPRINADLILTMERFIPKHPFTRYFMRTGDATALKLSDFFPDTRLREAPVYLEAYRRFGSERSLSVGITSRRSNAAGISVARTGRDFTERDRLMMNVLQPHFDLACRNAERATERRASSARPRADYALSPRETEVALWIARGKTNPEIAIILQASVRTVEKHVAKIIEKLGAENRTTAALMLANSGRGF